MLPALRRRTPAALALGVFLTCTTVGADAQGATVAGEGRNFALLIGTDAYSARGEWANLSSPVRDAATIAATLAGDYGFDTTVIRNATQAQAVEALIALKRRATRSGDRVLVFIASHGFFDEDRSQGYLVFRDSRPRAADVTRSSYMGLTNLLALHEGFTAGHVLLVIDACFAGSIDRDIRTGMDRGGAATGTSLRALDESVRRRSQYRSRTFLTSGGNEYVGDGGGPDGHSPFAGALIGALRAASAEALPLTFPDLLGRLDRAAVQPLPRHGTFAGHVPGGAFVFVPASFTSAVAASRSAPGGLPAARGVADAPVRGAAERAPPAAGNPVAAPRSAAGARPARASTVAGVPELLSASAFRSADALAGACLAGDDAECLTAARRVLLAHGVSRDEARARMLLERGCTRGVAAACAERDLLDARDRSDGTRREAGARRLQQRCDAVDAYACTTLARFRLGGGAGGSAGELFGVLRSACEGDVPAACVYAALASPADPNTRISRASLTRDSLLSHGCRALDPTACAFLARLYWESRATSQRALAGRLAEAACAVHDPVACSLLAEQYMYGTGVDLDYGRARTFAERACNARMGEGCYLLGRSVMLGLGTQRDAGAANRLYQRACEYGVRADCSRPLTPNMEIDWWRAVP